MASSEALALERETSAPETKALPPAPVSDDAHLVVAGEVGEDFGRPRPHVQRHRVAPLGIVEDHVADLPSLRESILSVLVLSSIVVLPARRARRQIARALRNAVISLARTRIP